MNRPWAATLFAVLLASGCGEDDPARPPGGFVFELVSVDGQPLPAPWRLSSEPRTVVRGRVLLGKWDQSVESDVAVWRLTLRAPDGTESELRTSRSYFRIGSVVGFDTGRPNQYCTSVLLPHSHAMVAGTDLIFPSENGWQALLYRQQ
jgi:hypothetical protein